MTFNEIPKLFDLYQALPLNITTLTHQDGIEEGNGVWTFILCVPSEPVNHLEHQRMEQLLSHLRKVRGKLEKAG